MTKPEIEAALSSWISLNDAIMSANEADCQQLLKAELDVKTGKRRKQFVFRIHSRLNKVRADREREELNEELL